MKVFVPKKKHYLANSPINSDVDLTIYRAYKYILKLKINPIDFVYERRAGKYNTHDQAEAHIAFSVLRDMGAKYVHCDPWGSD